MILSKKELFLGEVPPMGYAKAWDCWGRDAAVFFPFPLNIPAAWGRALYHFLIWRTGKQSVRDEALDEAYRQGSKDRGDSMQEHYDRMCQHAYQLGRIDEKRGLGRDANVYQG